MPTNTSRPNLRAGEDRRLVMPVEEASPATFGDEHFSDFFESLFGNRGGGGGGGGRKYRGQDFNAELHLSLREAHKTHQQTLTVNSKQVRITIPAGIANGQVIKLKGHGAPGSNGGPNGDLYITFVIAEDPTFKRLDNDLYTTVEIDLYTAVLGRGSDDRDTGT